MLNLPVPYRLYPDLPEVFEARIRILTEEEGGRKFPAYNGIRWNFRYTKDDGSKHYFPLYPDFYVPETGNSWGKELPLPVNKWLFARMYSIDVEPGLWAHQEFALPGVSFHCCEGGRIAAEGTVTRITGLFEERQ